MKTLEYFYRKKNELLEENEDKGNTELKTIGIVTFRLADEILGIELKYISEIINLTNISRLYCVPEYVVGLMNLRGQIKTIVDLKSFLGFQGESIDIEKIIKSKEEKGLLVHFEDVDGVLLVDKIEKVDWITEDLLREPPDTTPENLKEYTSYLVYTEAQPIVIISGEKILKSEIWSEFNEK